MPTWNRLALRTTSTRSLASCLASFVAALLLLAPGAVAQRPDDPGQVKFQGAAFPIAEEAGEVVIVVKRLRGSSGPAQVSYETTPGSATEGEDYVAATGILTWEDGDRADKTFTVEILDDDDDEGQETFGVRLFDPSDGLQIAPPSSAVVRITPSDRSDDGEGGEPDPEPETEAGVIRLTAISFPAFESSMVAEVSVERVDGTDGDVGVSFATVAGSATEGGDYTPTNGTLAWADGEGGVKTFQVPLVDDTEDEELETISVVLSLPTGGASIGSQDVGSIIIIDDDGEDGDCVPDATTLCLLDGRFQLAGTWLDFAGNTGEIQWVPTSDETGLGWFFDESNIELLLKMLEGCGLNDKIWVFLAATTNLEYQIVVTDLADGTTKTYDNALGEVAIVQADTTAFACTP
jgi:hypothetical protein